MKRLSTIEIFLIEFVLFLGLWLFNDYLGTLLSIILASISFFLLLIALVAEYLEPSRIPRWYFVIMTSTILAPLAAALVYWIIFGSLKW